MVYESDFYTTRRPYRTTPSYSTYTSSKREIPWEKVPFVPRPSLVPDPVTAFGKRTAESQRKQEIRNSILSAEQRANIKPKAYLEPVKPYVSARDATREKVIVGLLRNTMQPNAESMDYVLPKLHKVAEAANVPRLHRVSECPDLPYKRRMVNNSDFPPIY